MTAKDNVSAGQSTGDNVEVKRMYRDAPGTQPDIDNPDEPSGTQPDIDNPDLLPDMRPLDSEAVEAGAPALGYFGIVVAADEFTINDDGTVSFVPGDILAGEDETTVAPTNGGAVETVTISEYAEFATPTGCTEPYGEIDVDANGVGRTSCLAADYFAESGHFAPMIYLDKDWVVTKIADRYHP